MNLYNYFLSNQGPRIIKNTNFFPVYERYFCRYVNRPVLMFEIGTGDGGAARMWKHYFGPMARIVTIDIVDCKQFEESQVYVRTGDQSDPDFLRSLVDEFGAPDIVLDDGSHRTNDISNSFDILFPRTKSDGIYMVEDLFGVYWEILGGGMKKAGSFVEKCKDLIDELNGNEALRVFPETDFSRSVFSISFFHLMVVFEKTPFINRELLYLPKLPVPELAADVPA